MFDAVMRKDLGKIMKHSDDLFLKYKRTEPQDVKLVKDVDVSFTKWRHRALLIYMFALLINFVMCIARLISLNQLL
jgi:hypothetical protein